MSIRNGILMKEKEGMLSAAQQQAVRTNSIKTRIEKQPVCPKNVQQVLLLKAMRKCTIIDIAVPSDFNVVRTED